MSYSEVTPSLNVLNGLSDSPGTNTDNSNTTLKSTKKHTTTKNEANISTQAASVVQTKQPALVTPHETQAITTVLADHPEVYNTSPADLNSLWSDIGAPLMFVLVIASVFFAIMIHWARSNPVTGYAHQHKRVGGSSHNTPGKMQPRVFK